MSSSAPAIRTEAIGKRYFLGERRAAYRTAREALVRAATRPLRVWRKGTAPPPGRREELWALRDVSLSVERGEVVGIIGRNGAGKSTLLKILSRITDPTTGYAEIRGRAASLLEVGTGFHAELTGRENILLNGSILGLRRSEIAGRFDAIVAFAEVERFLDTPVKYYSSGMYLRLAFAVATHLEPEILFVDEVLAVGDVEFQRKCLGKMGEVSRQGRTVLFVSHNMPAVESLCPRAIWLDQGRVVAEGPSGDVLGRYLRSTARSSEGRSWNTPEQAPGNDRIRLSSVRVIPGEAVSVAEMSISTPFTIEIRYWNLVPGTRLNLSLSIFNQDAVRVLTTTTTLEPAWHDKPFPAGLFVSRCRIPGHLLNDGAYRTELLFVKDLTIPVCHIEDLVTFELRDEASMRAGYFGRWPGVVRPRLDWTTERLAEERDAGGG